MKTLHLNLMRKWFLMELKGIKKHEYRIISPYFCSKFLLVGGEHWTRNEWANHTWFHFLDNKSTNPWRLKRMIETDDSDIYYKEFDTATFSNGMATNAPRFEIEFNGFEINEGKTEWGAKKGEVYFVLKLGNIISKNKAALQLLNQ